MCKNKAHDQEHFDNSRRDFLVRSAWMTGAAMLFSALPVSAFSSRKMAGMISPYLNDNILILIQLKGGNDGLNTLIPLYDFNEYKKARKNIFIPKENQIKLTSEYAIPKTMKSLQPLWKNGMMKVINNVGYPNANLSHFRSEDIWTTGSGSQKTLNTGWLGRQLEMNHSDYKLNPPTRPLAVQIGGESSLISKGGMGEMGIAFKDAEELYKIAKSGRLSRQLETDGSPYGNALQYVRTVNNSSITYSKAIHAAYKKGRAKATYPQGEFGKKIQTVARLIQGGLGAKIYTISLEGFDTHANQMWKHQNLLEQLAQGVQALYQDLKSSRQEDKVLTMTFSEFGRRIEQNGSNGTDHGTAAPVMLFGGGLAGNGMFGTNANLKNADRNGNLIESTDYRQVYSTILQNWMGVSDSDTKSIFGQEFNTIKGLI